MGEALERRSDEGGALHRLAFGGLGRLRGATGALGRGADRALQRLDTGDGRRLSSTPIGAFGVAVLDGLIGDALEEEGSDLAEPMAVRVDGHVVPPDPDALAEAFPAATPRLVVFV